MDGQPDEVVDTDTLDATGSYQFYVTPGVSYWVQFGQQLYDEGEFLLKLPNRSEWSPQNVGADDTVGRITPGLLADLVIVDGDPLARMTDLVNVTGVMLNGRYHSLDTLLNPGRQLIATDP